MWRKQLRTSARTGAIATSAILFWLPGVLAQGPAKPTEYQVKAAYLYNFGKFVEWPARTDVGPFSICVLGRDPFGPALDVIVAGEAIKGQAVVATRLTRIEEATSCRIVFISASEEVRLSTILPALQATSALTVSDVPQFAKRGGMVQFVQDGTRVRFEINLTATGSAGLTLSSELLKVAAAVRRGA